MSARIQLKVMFRRARAMAAATALGSVLALSAFGAVQAQEGPMLRMTASSDDGRSIIASPEQMLARARATGGLRVIVGFEAGFEPEGSLSAGAATAQLARIASSRAEIMGRLEDPQLLREYESIPFAAMTVGAGDLARLIETPGVTSIVEDMLAEPLLDTSVRVIRANRLWTQQGITGTGWSVAVLDSGIRYNHRAFTDALPVSACYSSNGVDHTSLCRNQRTSVVGARAAPECPETTFGCGHGTHVAGTAAGNLRRNVRGVAYDSSIIPVQVFSQFTAAACQRATPCISAFFSDIIAGLDFVHRRARNTPIAAVNMSLGGSAYSSACDSVIPALTEITRNLVSRHVAVIAASGNSGFNYNVAIPACISWVIAVGATNDNDQVASFSNQAQGLTALMAPGVDINAPYFGGPRGTAELSGTSMASPHVAGAFALLRSAFPSATVHQILTALSCTGVPVNRPGHASYPRIDVAAARVFLNQGRLRC